MQLVLNLSYQGKPFHGFARLPEMYTVQGELESALSQIFRRPILTVCAGRTDAGVHARDQYVNFELLPEEYEQIIQDSARFSRKLLSSCHALLPEEIVIRAIYVADDEFSARFSACSRLYRYRIKMGPTRPLYTAQFVSWHQGELDVEAMREAACYLVGEHDFASFCKARSAEGKNTVRCVSRLEIFKEEAFGEELLCVEIQANAFLHSMVRTIVGSLIEVGVHRREPVWMAKVLQACSRQAAGPNAPACGLSLWKVEYPHDSLTLLE